MSSPVTYIKEAVMTFGMFVFSAIWGAVGAIIGGLAVRAYLNKHSDARE